MFAIGRLAIAATTVAALSLSAHAASFPTVPQSELNAFCQEYGAARVHLATFFLDGGVGLRGHVNCTKVTFTPTMLLPPLDEQVAATTG